MTVAAGLIAAEPLAADLLAGPDWAWALAAFVAAAALGLWWGRRGPRTAPPPDLLWAALAKQPPGDSTDESWRAAVQEVRRLRETARRVQRLQLRTTAVGTEFQLLSDVLRALTDGIVVLDRSERILYANRTAQRILGLDSHDSPGLEQARASFEIVDGIRSVLFADLARKVKRRKVQWGEGDEQRTYVIRCLMPDDPPGKAADSFIVVLEDHTSEERTGRAKTEFIYGISHELKTPLTSIQASLEMLIDEPNLPGEQRDKLVRLSLGESTRLTRMLHELLDLARVEAGITEFVFERVVLEDMLSDLRELHQPLAERESITLTWDVSEYLPTVQGDAGLLRQAFVNLIGNAVKYTKRGGSVTLSAGLQGNELVVRIRDTGIGIAEEDLPRIFDKFFRAGSAKSSRVQGTGLGLPMARYIIERHRGRIEVTSEIDQGSEFTVSLPAGSADDETGTVGSKLVAVDGVMS